MSDYPMLISNKLHSFRNFQTANLNKKRDGCSSDMLYLNTTQINTYIFIDRSN